MTGADALLVDLDGTLYHALPVKIAMAAELVLRGGGAVPVVRRFRLEHVAIRRDVQEPVEDPFRLQLERTARATGRPVPEVEAVVREWMIRRPLRWIGAWRREALVAEIEAFRRAGRPVAVVSDYPARAKLRALRLEEQVEAVVACGEPGGPPRLKPWPDGYLLAAERLGVAPGRCLVIGDSPADREAARRAGMAFRPMG